MVIGAAAVVAMVGVATAVVEQSLQSLPDERLQVIGLQNLGRLLRLWIEALVAGLQEA